MSNAKTNASFIFLLCFTPVLFGAVFNADSHIKQTVSDTGTGVINTGSGTIVIGLTQDGHEEILQRREKKIRSELELSHANSLKAEATEKIRLNKHIRLLESYLETVRQHLKNIEQSYKEHINDLRNRIAQLETIRGQMPEEILNAAQQALANGENENADTLFKQIIDQVENPIKAAAEANYQRCLIAEDEVRLFEALSLCVRSIQLMPDNFLYLNKTGKLADTLALYKRAIEYYELALSNALKTKAGMNPWVVVIYNNMGVTWRNLGDEKKAIEHFMLALKNIPAGMNNYPYTVTVYTNLSVSLSHVGDFIDAFNYLNMALYTARDIFDEQDPSFAPIYNELGRLAQFLDIYQDAVTAHQLSLAILLKAYGPLDSRVASVCAQLGHAWVELAEYQKAIEYYELALSIFQHVVGVEHPSYRKTSGDLRAAQALLKGELSSRGEPEN